MIFRCCDKDGFGYIKIEDFNCTLKDLNIGLRDSHCTRITQILDEDCSGSIFMDEFKTVLSRYYVNQEGQVQIDQMNSEKRIFSRIRDLLTKKKISAEDAFKQIDKLKKGYIKGQTLMLYFESLGAQLKDMDLFVFLRIVDVYRSNVITYKKF